MLGKHRLELCADFGVGSRDQDGKVGLAASGRGGGRLSESGGWDGRRLMVLVVQPYATTYNLRVLGAHYQQASRPWSLSMRG